MSNSKVGIGVIWCLKICNMYNIDVPLYWSIVFSITAVKFLLLPSYKSTDFEVHRNWLAITHNLDKEKWYYENSSQWTLDYPPFFAWFECGLSQIAKFFDPEMLNIHNFNYKSDMTILFQRCSVIVTDFVYAFAVYRCCKFIFKNLRLPKRDEFADDRFILCMLLMTNVGSLMVDHIHFQYNGLLYGILLISILCILQNRYREAAVWFAVLLNFKHIFLYMAPAYAIYLLRNYCLTWNKDHTINWAVFAKNLLRLAIIVIVVFGISFGPFINDYQLPQVLSRLFPFKRGLTHAYWAPNFWALYNSLDKALTFGGLQLQLIDRSKIVPSSMTRGLVGEYHHAVLPSLSPLIASIISALAMLPTLITLWKRPYRPMEFVRSLTLCAFASFMFGWHVHEKAILMIIIPLSILAMLHVDEARMFLIISTVGHYSLMPLLYEEAESPTKILMFMLFTLYAFFSLALKYRQQRPFPLPLLCVYESVYILGLIPLQLYTGVLQTSLGLNDKYPFLPLMLTSLYCGIGMFYAWGRLNWISWHKPLPQMP